MTRAIEEISTGKLDVEIEPGLVKTDDEVGDLAKAFNRIIVSLKLAMQNTSDKNKKAD